MVLISDMVMARSLQLVAAAALFFPSHLVPRIHLPPEVPPAKDRGMLWDTHYQQRTSVMSAWVTSKDLPVNAWGVIKPAALKLENRCHVQVRLKWERVLSPLEGSGPTPRVRLLFLLPSLLSKEGGWEKVEFLKPRCLQPSRFLILLLAVVI